MRPVTQVCRGPTTCGCLGAPSDHFLEEAQASSIWVTGRATWHLGSPGLLSIRYVGIDVSDAMLEQAQRTSHSPLGARFIHADIERFESRSYADWALVLANVLHYLSDLTVLETLPQRFGRARTLSIAETGVR